MQLDVLAFGAHPDDVELTCAGTIIKLGAKGYKTGVIALTRGEMGTRGTPEIRQQEFETAGKIMGLTVHKALDLPDGNVEVNWENKLRVIREIRQYRPRIVFAPYWFDRHPDHGHCGRLVREAVFLAGLKRIDTGQPHFRPAKVIHYPARYEFTPSFIVDVSDHFDQRMKAVRAYQSQFYRPEAVGEDETFISRPEFLEAIETRAKYWGTHIGAKYGEPFLVVEALRVEDPVELFGEQVGFLGP